MEWLAVGLVLALYAACAAPAMLLCGSGERAAALRVPAAAALGSLMAALAIWWAFP